MAPCMWGEKEEGLLGGMVMKMPLENCSWISGDI